MGKVKDLAANIEEAFVLDQKLINLEKETGSDVEYVANVAFGIANRYSELHDELLDIFGFKREQELLIESIKRLSAY